MLAQRVAPIVNCNVLDSDSTRELLLRTIEEKCLISGKSVTLSVGESSNFYFDCKKATLDGAFLDGFANYTLNEIIPKISPQPDVVGGLTLGADFMTAALVMRAAQMGIPLTQGSIVRKEAKVHGTLNMVENEQPKGKKVLAVDDVITSGGSVAKACRVFQECGLEIVGIICLVDREQGGRENLEKEFPGVPVLSLFKKSDFPELTALA